jgi:hypothetical protein
MSAQTTQTGIVVRQAMDPQSTVLTNSPDLIVTGVAPVFDPGPFTDSEAYGWYFSQAPAIGKPNYLYVRGLNYSSQGAQTAVVYLYWVQSDQVLNPAKWQSTGITVGGKAQNNTPISSQSQYEYVVTTTTVLWTPPQPTTAGASYFLISWIDNSASPVPPTFPSTPFASLAALGEYVQANPQMAMLDTVYRGAFLRQFPNQLVTQGGTGAQTSTDILVYGTLAAQDASTFTTPASYGSSALIQTAGLGARNFVYLRALNTGSGAGTSRVYLYWATTSALSPPAWAATYFTFGGQPQNWVDLAFTAGNQVAVSTVPLVWNPPPLGAGTSYVLIAYVDNSASPEPPDFGPFGYLNPADVTAFVAGHPQLAWLAVTGSAVSPPTMSWEQPIVPATGVTTVYAGIQFHGIPADGTVSLSIPGPDSADTIVIPSMKVPDPNALVAWPLTYSSGFVTSAVLSYTAGGTAPPGGATITAVVLPRTGS